MTKFIPGASNSKVVAVGTGTQTFINDTTSDQNFTAVYTIPANALFANKVYRVNLIFQSIAGTTTVTRFSYLKLGSTKVYNFSVGIDVTDGVTRGVMCTYLIYGTGAAGASVNVTTGGMMNAHFNTNNQNAINQPVALATNGTLAITPGITYSGTGSTESFQLLAWSIEELN